MPVCRPVQGKRNCKPVIRGIFMNTIQPPVTKVRGQNVLEEADRKTALQRFFEQLNDPLIFILFIAAAISLLLREYSDTA
ncbi:MAG: hypothetical protein K2G20_00405, partial [Lachnospiraceae bacterium]|nr:hypothetical protein [Lachnospiraceae bacterium]